MNAEALLNELTKAFVRYQYNLDNPMSSKTDEEIWKFYLTDSLFHRKVKNLVAGVFQIVEKHITS